MRPSRTPVCPLVDFEPGHHLLELFHGPTLAFKDVALQLLGRLFDHELERRDQRVTIVGAASGGTGSAAVDAVRDATGSTSSSSFRRATSEVNVAR